MCTTLLLQGITKLGTRRSMKKHTTHKEYELATQVSRNRRTGTYVDRRTNYFHRASNQLSVLKGKEVMVVVDKLNGRRPNGGRSANVGIKLGLLSSQRKAVRERNKQSPRKPELRAHTSDVSVRYHTLMRGRKT
jgi:hypothetical protein